MELLAIKIHDLSCTNSRLRSTFLVRRRSSGAEPLAIKSNNTAEMRQHFKHLGPSNVASRPKQTRINTIKVKPGAGNTLVDQLTPLPETAPLPIDGTKPRSRAHSVILPGEDGANESTGLLAAGRFAKDGVHALGYGGVSPSPTTKTGDWNALIRAQTYDSPPTAENEMAVKIKQTIVSPPPMRHASSSSSKSSPSAPAKLILELSPAKEDNATVSKSGGNTKQYMRKFGLILN